MSHIPLHVCELRFTTLPYSTDKAIFFSFFFFNFSVVRKKRLKTYKLLLFFLLPYMTPTSISTTPKDPPVFLYIFHITLPKIPKDSIFLFSPQRSYEFASKLPNNMIPLPQEPSNLSCPKIKRLNNQIHSGWITFTTKLEKSDPCKYQYHIDEKWVIGNTKWLSWLRRGRHSYWKVVRVCAALKTPFFGPFFHSGDPPF